MIVDDVTRTKTGIQGMDKALSGGVPQGNLVLISGGAGTGKSTLCLQFLINGATLFGEKGLYISTEQSRKELVRQASCFNWNIEALEQMNLLKVWYYDLFGDSDFPSKLDKVINEFKPKRLVIDSLTTLVDNLTLFSFSQDKPFSMVQIAETVTPVPLMNKNILYRLFREIKKFGHTVFLTTELPEENKTFSADGISEFIADGVVLLRATAVGSQVDRTMQICKMRYTSMVGGIKSYSMDINGISFVM